MGFLYFLSGVLIGLSIAAVIVLPLFGEYLTPRFRECLSRKLNHLKELFGLSH